VLWKISVVLDIVGAPHSVKEVAQAINAQAGRPDGLAVEWSRGLYSNRAA
jgi:hypothetical protein